MSSKLIETSQDWTLTILRIAAGIMIFPHGLQKTFGWFGGAGFSAQMAGFERSHIPAVFGFLAIMAEFLGGLGLIFGGILTATQYPFRDRRQIAPSVGLPMNKVRVVMAPVGGGFGRKDDITTEIHAGLLALKTGRPVRLVYTREESLFALTKRLEKSSPDSPSWRCFVISSLGTC